MSVYVLSYKIEQNPESVTKPSFYHIFVNKKNIFNNVNELEKKLQNFLSCL